MPHSPLSPDSETGVLIHRLGYAGLLPFVLLAFLLWIVTPEAHPFVAIALTAYAATIASFLGVIPSLVAWVAVIMPAYAGLPLLGLLLVACYLVDRKTWPEAGLRDWMTLRFRLTVVATLSCVIAAGAT